MILHLDPHRARRHPPLFAVYFDDDRAARIFGESFRRQRLYAWSLAEAREIARVRGGEVREA
jgi:hypothetical protein